MFRWKPAAQALGILTLVSVTALAAACGGDDDSSSATSSAGAAKTSAPASGAVKVDPAKADALAHQAMLVPQDLPGTGWSVTKTDQFDDSGPGDSTPACKAVSTAETESRKKSAEGRAGRAETELSKSSASSAIPTSVEIEVNVFKDNGTPSAALAALREQLKGTNFEGCLKDTIGAALPPGLKVDTKAGTPQTSAPQGGEAKAYDFTFSVQGLTLALHIEMYAWQYGNTGTTVTISGAKDETTADLVKGAVAKADTKVQALGK